MVTIVPNKFLLERVRTWYDRELDPVIFDFFDYMLTMKMDPFDVESLDELLEVIIHLKNELIRVHITNANLRAGRVTQTLDASKFQFRQNEIALIIHTYFPLVRLKLTRDAKVSQLALFHYFGNYAGTYQFETDLLDDIIYILQPNVSVSNLKSYRQAIAALAPHKTEDKQRDLVVVGNGIYNRQTQTLEPFNPHYVTTTKIATNYDPDARLVTIHNDEDGSDWNVDDWLKDLAGQICQNFDQDTYQLFWQIIAATINPDQVNAKAIFFFSSVGNNGKGTYGQLLKNLVGIDNYSSLPIPAFKHEFMKEKLLGKTLNIADENPVDIYVDDIQDFKAMITGDDILINRKYDKPLAAQIKAINIQMLNGLPKTRDKSDSFYRRLIIVPFIYSFTNNGEKAYIKKDYVHRPQVLEYILKKALEMPSFSDFVTPQRSLDALEEYKENNNSAVQFWNEFEPRFQWDFLPPNFLYDLYTAWLKEEYNGDHHAGFSKKAFLHHLENHLRQNPQWNFKATRSTSPNPISIGKMMDADEPLITEYNLDRFQDPNYKGQDPLLKRAFPCISRGRGIVRVTP